MPELVKIRHPEVIECEETHELCLCMKCRMWMKKIKAYPDGGVLWAGMGACLDREVKAEKNEQCRKHACERYEY